MENKKIPDKDTFDRIVLEREELFKKINALKSFINTNPIFLSLEEDQQLLLHMQYNAMIVYNDILSMRLSKIK